MNGPTPKELSVLRFIAEYKMREGVQPTNQQIAKALGFSSRENAHQAVVRLRSKGILGLDNTLTEAGQKHLPNRCPHCGCDIYV